MKGGINPRSRWEIILDILRVISQEERESEGNEKKTRVMQRAYLDWWSFQRYSHFLLEQGFVEKSKSPEGGISYDLTEKGRDLLESLKEVEDILRQPA
ncbi:MAG: winged helix-turn-helix domain-containing protein [Halobacteriota archaeon]